MGSGVKKLCFSKKLLITDYIVLFLMLIIFTILSFLDRNTTEWAVVLGVWGAQLAVSTGAYYWKARSENLLKMPMQLYKDLPENVQERIDINQLIDSVFNLKN